ncbi:MAG: methyltransferase [Desulfobulbaceae bacterium]|nr:methyltransferase [Desulfobulbaceae bacterium]
MKSRNTTSFLSDPETRTIVSTPASPEYNLAAPCRTPDKRLRPQLALYLPDIPPHLLPGGFDTIGDIALLTLPQSILSQADRIGEVILTLFKHIGVVALRQGNYSGAQRLIALKVVAGEQRLTTLHRENGVSLYLDLATVYFSTRLAGERMRIAQLVQAQEKVCVLGSGAGPYPLTIARHSQAQTVDGIEMNPAAHSCGLQSLRKNRCLTTVRLHSGEASAKLASLQQSFDRIVIALPWHAASLLQSALGHLRPKGILHCYAMEMDGSQSSLMQKLAELCASRARRIKSINSVKCGHCGYSGKRLFRICHDVIIN